MLGKSALALNSAFKIVSILFKLKYYSSQKLERGLKLLFAYLDTPGITDINPVGFSGFNVFNY
jgi:hypothetical protein